MKWITRNNVSIDYIACSWLIKKYLDKDVTFEFIDHVEVITEDMGIPIDVPGCKYSHRRGRCTFNTLLNKYNIKDSILDNNV